ncbi:MAG: hypothetical protein K8R76_01595 [Candidatus Aegiribacteria sp.]|nr:hypothetical protein [Candidatus Aegiribacteria sp.]
MQNLINILLILTQSVTFGSPIMRDVPIAATLLPDGSCGILLQSHVPECPLTLEIVILSPGDDPVIISILRNIEDPVWPRGSGWTSDGMLSLIVSSYSTGHEFSDIVTFTSEGVLSDSIRIPGSGQSLSVTGGTSYHINSLLPLFDGSGYWLSSDLVDYESWEVLSKFLFRLGPQGDTLWSRSISCPGYWMNPDVIRSMPDGGCVVGSDEDGFNNLLFLNRISSSGKLIWSVEIETGGEMTHVVEDILPANDGGTLVIASSDQFGMQDNCLICLIDTEGEIVNEVFEAGLGHAVCTCGIPIEGGFLLAGWTGSVNDDGAIPVEEGILILRLDEYGTTVAMDVIPFDGNCEPLFLLETQPGYLIIGTCWEDIYTDSDVFTMLIPTDEIP